MFIRDELDQFYLEVNDWEYVCLVEMLCRNNPFVQSIDGYLQDGKR